ncbi:MAG TPA: alkaline phosphatase family protein [Candidatus Baltobacteraceae bacterium]|nr:alkaline phosphatase family protein [Candidatus Baltobacteraceae bacterium]
MSSVAVLIAAVVACSGPKTGALPQSAVKSGENLRLRALSSPNPIKHVVILIMENRSVDNLFNGFPNADTVTSGQDSQGNTVPLHQVSLTAPYDLLHSHKAFETEYNNGSMNGFDLETYHLVHPSPSPSPLVDAAYGIVPQSEVQPDWTIAEQYAFADRMFQTNSGPSFPAHQYLISGTSATGKIAGYSAMENPNAVFYDANIGGCDSKSGTSVRLINPSTNDQSKWTFPCFDHTTLMDLLDAQSVTWKYYSNVQFAGLWNAPDAIKHLRYNPNYKTYDVAPADKTFFADVTAGSLPAVSWVIPSSWESDHAGVSGKYGPAFVAKVVNAIGLSPYWSNTAIFITWDDWGGWYDHVPPPQYNYYELGMRVPLIAVSPYALPGYVSHTQHEFGSILNFVEETFNIPCAQPPPNCGALGYTDMRADDLGDMFNFSQTPIPFKQIPAQRVPDGILSNDQNPDND